MTLKEQLQLEISQVEKILELVKNPSTLGEANSLNIHFMKTEKTHTFSSIEINEYLAFFTTKYETSKMAILKERKALT